MKKLKLWHYLLLVFLLAGTTWILSKSAAQSMHVSEGKIFGTVYHIKYKYTHDLHDEIRAELQKVDASLSLFNDSSLLSRLNRNETDECDSLFVEVWQKAQAVSRATDGAFDVTVAPLVNAWGFGFKNADNVTQARIDSLLPWVGYEKIALENGRLRKPQPETTLDFGAIAKGYGVDRVAAMLSARGISDFMVEIGGEVVTRGRNAEGKSWRIGVNKPVEGAQEMDLQSVLAVGNVALATSGNYRNFYYRDGKKYAHSIDPRTGWPVQHSLLSASVMAPDCATADAYATAFMVMGMEKARKILEGHPELMAYFIYADADGNYKVWYSQGIGKMLVE